MSKMNKYIYRTINLNNNKLFRIIIVNENKPVINSKSNRITFNKANTLYFF